MVEARYDEVADWYDEQVRGDDHQEDCIVCTDLRLLDDGRPGLVVDLGCGTAAHRNAITTSDREIVGVDLSAGLLKHALPRLSAVAVGNATMPPIRPGAADVVVTTFVHTDVSSAEALFGAVHDLLRPGGTALVVGAHPCFNNPFFGRNEAGQFVVHPGYRRPGFYTDGPGLGDGIRSRVGVNHLPLAEYLNSVVASDLQVEEWAEGGPEPPILLGFRARRCS